MKKKLPLYIADIDTDTSQDRMLALSLTKTPASGLKGKVVGKDAQGTRMFFPILPASQPIYRNNEVYGEHYVMFLPDVIQDIMLDASRRNIPFDLEHSGCPLDGIEWLESYQVDYQQGKNYKGYTGLTDGTWVGTLNLVNPTLPPQTCPQNIFGISISGIFSYHRVELSEAIEMYRKLKF